MRQPRVPLLSAMARDLADHGSLRLPTSTAMWAAYAGHGLLTAWALRRRAVPLPARSGPARLAGVAMVAAGAAMCVAGMTRFTSPRELTGTRNEPLTTIGLYRYSRNPQYLGYLLVLAGAAVARRSGGALLSTGLLAATYATWIPVEEDHLTHLHGQPYVDYMTQTRRWWGRPDSSTRTSG
ncbi:MAG TPA: methyltransferase [Nocardioidaceae bacterium]|nr:methyltransferase [Nocardioidaceae bacterium]